MIAASLKLSRRAQIRHSLTPPEWRRVRPMFGSVVGMSRVTLGGAVVIWRVCDVEERWGSRLKSQEVATVTSAERNLDLVAPRFND